MQSILITGGAGFIGSNFIHYWFEKYNDTRIVNLDLLTYAGSFDEIKIFEDNQNYTFIQGDICDRNLVQQIFADFHITSVIHFAAESHVDNSIKFPDVFVRTNVLGTFNLLDAAYSYWHQNHIRGRFHHISTDEVYGSLGETGLFDEKTAYAPNSPYSASKAGSDMLVRSYIKTYGLDAVITNCSNNYGPRQHDEKLIPTIIRHALNNEDIPIYGDGKNVRDWLFVEDHCNAVDKVFHDGKIGETYNIGANNELSNNELALKVCKLLDLKKPKSPGKYQEQLVFVEDRKGHDFRYAVDGTKIKKKLAWQANTAFDEGLGKTINHYLKKYLG